MEKELLNVQDILNLIDKRFHYRGVDEKDHLITQETWKKYKSIYNKTHLNSRIKKSSGQTKNAKYRKEDVEKIINYRKKELKEQYLRKTVVLFPEEVLTDMKIPEIRVSISQSKKWEEDEEEGLDEYVNNYIAKVKERIWSMIDEQLVVDDAFELAFPSGEHLVTGEGGIDIREDTKERYDNPLMYLKIRKNNQNLKKV